ncbi:hypothetical protein AB4Z45_23270 [Paenibacillus sp. MCAF9]|uniref:hypothetical protein n=1 Tax=Paenibacillus sp. MCAF9 TaxID=3233046 RepID=UPI003F973CDE
MEYIETGLKLFVFIIVISLFFSLARFLVQKYLNDFFQGFSEKTIKIFSLLKGKFQKTG